ncbi:MAG TPA: hypothetical protein VMW31_00550 [Devosiaceae bacterium]|nr:hypothetical protein [Devosiaceae bacterium]
MLARIIVFVLVFAAIYFGWRAITRNFRDYFRGADEAARERHRLEARRPDVVDLERDPETGVFKPGGKDGPDGGPKDKPGS